MHGSRELSSFIYPDCSKILALAPAIQIYTKMPKTGQKQLRCQYSEDDILAVMADFDNDLFTTIKHAAEHHEVPCTTLQHRINGQSAWGIAQKQPNQLLSDAQEQSIVNMCK